MLLCLLNGLKTIYENQRLTFISKRGIFIYLAIVCYWLSTLVKQYATMARYLKRSLYYPLAPAHYNPSLTFYKPLNNNSQSYAQTKIKPFYCTKSVIAPVKGFRMVRAMQKCITVLFQMKKKERTITKMQGKHIIENLFLLFVIIALEHIGT